MIHIRHSLTDRIRGELFLRDFGMGFSVAMRAKHKSAPMFLCAIVQEKIRRSFYAEKKKNNR